jgi:hypothetical protein
LEDSPQFYPENCTPRIGRLPNLAVTVFTAEMSESEPEPNPADAESSELAQTTALLLATFADLYR